MVNAPPFCSGDNDPRGHILFRKPENFVSRHELRERETVVRLMHQGEREQHFMERDPGLMIFRWIDTKLEEEPVIPQRVVNNIRAQWRHKRWRKRPDA